MNKTRERIQDVALALFNASGTYSVTTNHIADAAQLSIGNLYYHFKNKEEIVRALYERLTQDSAAAFVLPTDRPPTIEDLEGLIAANFTILWKYRFFYREIMGLTMRDPLLAGQYRAVREGGYRNFGALFAQFHQSEVFRAATADEITQLAEVCWILSEFYIAYVELGGEEPTESHRFHGITLFRQLLRPYLAAAGPGQ
ncbi:MAG: TetR/AcrR family transcriptional regulator, partial [Capsulimonadales bacterium]|nr:TetR/AcrR family transcriptional regulator [Capsulimonadales bacterium]